MEHCMSAMHFYYAMGGDKFMSLKHKYDHPNF